MKKLKVISLIAFVLVVLVLPFSQALGYYYMSDTSACTRIASGDSDWYGTGGGDMIRCEMEQHNF